MPLLTIELLVGSKVVLWRLGELGSGTAYILRFGGKTRERFVPLARLYQTRFVVLLRLEVADAAASVVVADGAVGTGCLAPGDVRQCRRAQPGRPLQRSPAEVGSREVGPAEVRPAEVAITEVGPAEIGPAEIGPAE